MIAPVRLQVRALVSALVKDAVPANWKSGLVQAAMGAASWVDDLGKRIVHLENVSRPGAKSGPDASPYWLGGLFSPDAFVTASRQHVARALSCSLEELKLSLVVGPAEETSAEGGDYRHRAMTAFHVLALSLLDSRICRFAGCIAGVGRYNSARVLWLNNKELRFWCFNMKVLCFWCVNIKEPQFFGRVKPFPLPTAKSHSCRAPRYFVPVLRDVRAHFRPIHGFPDHRVGAGRSRLERSDQDPGLFQGSPQSLGPLPTVLDPAPRGC